MINLHSDNSKTLAEGHAIAVDGFGVLRPCPPPKTQEALDELIVQSLEQGQEIKELWMNPRDLSTFNKAAWESGLRIVLAQSKKPVSLFRQTDDGLLVEVDLQGRPLVGWRRRWTRLKQYLAQRWDHRGYWKVPFRSMYYRSFRSMVKQAAWIFIVKKLWPYTIDVGSDALKETYLQEPMEFFRQHQSTIEAAYLKRDLPEYIQERAYHRDPLWFQRQVELMKHDEKRP